MGRPLGSKNHMRTAEEKEAIVLECLNGKAGYRAVSAGHDLNGSVLKTWIRKYRENGIEGLRSRTGRHTNGNSGHYERHPSEAEKLKKELLKKEIEIERLKKGYQAKGGGGRKEFVTTFDANTKSLKD